MIVRIMGEGQFELAASAVDEANVLDEALIIAVDNGDEATFQEAFAALEEYIRTQGKPLADTDLRASEATLPFAGATLAEVKALLPEDGLIPGRPGQ